VRAPEEQVHLIFDLEWQRVRVLTVVRHLSVCVVAVDKECGLDAGDDLCFAAILYFFTPVSTWIFCFNLLITLSTEFTELPRSFAISSLE
jgi:hypothetical protein